MKNVIYFSFLLGKQSEWSVCYWSN